MKDPDPRPPLVDPALLGGAKKLVGVLVAAIAVGGGVLTLVVAAMELVDAATKLFAHELDQVVVYTVKAIDAVLLGLVQFLLAAFLWQVLDPKESLLDDENLERLEEVKQILCKVVLVIVAVRMLSVVVEPAKMRWEHLVFPAGILALALATSMLGRARNAAKG